MRGAVGLAVALWTWLCPCWPPWTQNNSVMPERYEFPVFRFDCGRPPFTRYGAMPQWRCRGYIKARDGLHALALRRTGRLFDPADLRGRRRLADGAAGRRAFSALVGGAPGHSR